MTETTERQSKRSFILQCAKRILRKGLSGVALSLYSLEPEPQTKNCVFCGEKTTLPIPICEECSKKIQSAPHSDYSGVIRQAERSSRSEA